MTPFSMPLCLTWTACLLLASVAGNGYRTTVGCSLCILAVAACRSKSLRPVRLAIALFVPFAAPLFLIHAVLNPGFPVSGSFAGIPIRQAGASYAVSVSARLLGIVCVGSLWRFVSADTVIDTLIRWRFPSWSLVLAAQSVSLVSLIRHRAATVALAQQARGVPVRGSVLQRFRAAPLVLLPVTLRVISEVDERALILTTRGCGTGPISVLSGRKHPPIDRAAAWLSVVACVLVYLAT